MSKLRPVSFQMMFGWMQKNNRLLAEKVGERETCNASYVLKNIYFKMTGRFAIVLSTMYKQHVQCKSKGDWKESQSILKALCSLDPALSVSLTVRVWTWHFIKISRVVPGSTWLLNRKFHSIWFIKSLTVLLAMALDKGGKTYMISRHKVKVSQKVEWKSVKRYFSRSLDLWYAQIWDVCL